MGPFMMDFKTFFGKQKRGTRQQRGYTGQTRLHQNLVPAMHKNDPSLNRKVEDLRELHDDRRILTVQEIGKITTKYGIRNLSKEHPRMLGRSGIKIYWDTKIAKWCISKGN